MKPVEFPQQNVIVKSMSPGVGDLPAYHDGGVIISMWALDADEIAALKMGACIQLAVYTAGDPVQPISIKVSGTSAQN